LFTAEIAERNLGTFPAYYGGANRYQFVQAGFLEIPQWFIATIVLSIALIPITFFGIIYNRKRRLLEKPTQEKEVSKPGIEQKESPEALADRTEGKYCRYCGSENKVDAIFCEKCGKNIS